jgi:hypothetical protein
MIDDAKDVLLIVNVALTIKNMIIRLIRFLEAFLLDLGFHPHFSDAFQSLALSNEELGAEPSLHFRRKISSQPQGLFS